MIEGFAQFLAPHFVWHTKSNLFLQNQELHFFEFAI